MTTFTFPTIRCLRLNYLRRKLRPKRPRSVSYIEGSDISLERKYFDFSSLSDDRIEYILIQSYEWENGDQISSEEITQLTKGQQRALIRRIEPCHIKIDDFSYQFIIDNAKEEEPDQEYSEQELFPLLMNESDFRKYHNTQLRTSKVKSTEEGVIVWVPKEDEILLKGNGIIPQS